MLTSSFHRFGRHGLRALALCSLLPVLANATEPAGPPRRDVPTNAAGQPLTDSAGQPLRYTREQWQAAPVVPAAAASRSAAAPAVSPAAATVTPRRANWSWAPLGSGIGLAGLLVTGQGAATEIIVGGGGSIFSGNEYWQVLRYAPALRDFQPIFVSPLHSAGVKRLLLARLGNPARAAIVVGLGDGTVELHDQSTRQLVSSFTGPCASRGGLSAMAVADLDGNGSDEFVSSCANAGLVVHGPGYTAWEVPSAGGDDVIVGQFDNDTALEIASTTGHVIDSASHAVQWRRSDGFGVQLQAADIDGDARQELIAADAWYFVWSFDVERQLPKWSIPIEYDVGRILVTDIDSDGIHELLVGDGQWGAIHAYDTRTEQEEWRIANPDHGTAALATADVNADGRRELLWSGGATSSGSDHLYMANWQTGRILWQNEHLDGPFLGPRLGDLDGDGVAELVTASFTSESGYESGRIVVFDARSGRLRAISPGVAGGDFGSTGLHDIELRNVLGDGRLEIVIGTDWLFDGLIEVYGFSSDNQFSLLWSNTTRPSGSPFMAVEAADVDGDGTVEILGGNGQEFSSGAGTFIHAFDLDTGVRRWRSLHMPGGSVADLEVASTDGDSAVEIVARISNNSIGDDVYVFDGPTHAIEALIDTRATALDIVGQESGARLLLGGHEGRLSVRAFNGATYPEIAGGPVANTTIDSLRYTARGQVWVGAGGVLRLQTQAGAVLFETASYGSGFARDIALTNSAVYSASQVGVHGFRLAP